MISSGMNVVGVQYLVIMNLGVAIYNYTISNWNRMVSMQFEVAALCGVKGITLTDYTRDWMECN